MTSPSCSAEPKRRARSIGVLLMAVRDELLKSIADTIADYREGEIDRPTPEHVDRWVSQFPAEVQVELLREMDHVLKATYFSKENVREFLEGLITTAKLVGADPCAYWRSVNFIRGHQRGGHSQAALLEFFSEVLEKSCGFGVSERGSTDGPFVYIDDTLFTGGTVGADLVEWLGSTAPQQSAVEVIVIAAHTFGSFKVDQRIAAEASRLGKKVTLRIWRAEAIENRLSERNASEVLWPIELPDDAELAEYAASQKFPFQPRVPGGKLRLDLFSSESGRQLLERELLLKGAYIRSVCDNPSQALRPLGFGPFGLGFGSTVVTYRNCPNNAPLALWWGDPDANPSHPFSKWYPLVPRNTHQDEPLADFDLAAFLEGL